MNNHWKFVVASILLPLLAGGNGLAQTAAAPPPVTGNCGMQLGGIAIFCDTFDTKNAEIPSRTGSLDPNVWGVSRAVGGVNFGQAQYNGWDSRQCFGSKVNDAYKHTLFRILDEVDRCGQSYW